jgi:hypothetical protein
MTEDNFMKSCRLWTFFGDALHRIPNSIGERNPTVESLAGPKAGLWA